MSGSGGGIQGAPNLAVIDAITQFLGGTEAVWNTITIPIPTGMVVYAVDTTVLKMGDGVTLYAALPVLLTLNQIVTLNNQVNTLAATCVTTTALTATLTNYVTSAALSTLLNMYRIRLTAAMTLYVTTGGSDTTGTGTLAAPFATPQKAWTYASDWLDLVGNPLTIDLGVGTFPPLYANNLLTGQVGPVYITGVDSTTILGGTTVAVSDVVIAAELRAIIQLSNLQVTAPTAGILVGAGDGAIVYLGAGIVLGQSGNSTGGTGGTPNWNAQMSVWNGGEILPDPNNTNPTTITATGSALCLAQSQSGGTIDFSNINVKFQNALTYTGAVLMSNTSGIISYRQLTWQNPSNLALGVKQYDVSTAGVLNTSGTYADIPGNVTGTSYAGSVTAGFVW
jgi:hypothetical protein